MHPPGPFARRRFVAAIVVSLSLHALVAVAWLHGRATVPAADVGFDVRVAGPGDDEPSFTLLDTKPERDVPPIKKSISPPPMEEPNKLPKGIVAPSGSGIERVNGIGTSSDVPKPLTKSGGSAPLHGKLKAGKTIVYVLDRSASMGPEDLLGRAIESLKASLAQVGSDARFQIVAYNGGTSAFAREPVAATASNIEQALVWLKELTAEGRSNHQAGFQEALSFQPDALFLLTDADDLEESDIRAIQRLMRSPVALHAVVFGNQRPKFDTPLERLSQASGGVKYVGPNMR